MSRKTAESAKAMIDLPAVLKEKHTTRAAIARETGLAECTVSTAIRGDACSIKTAAAISEAHGLKLDKAFLTVDENKALSPKTVTEHHRLISTVLKQAVKDGLIPYNVAANAEIPRAEKKEVQSLQTADLPQSLAALETEPMKWKVITHLLLITGCRRGEILGLKWEAVDFLGDRLHINNNVLYSADKGVYQDTPKTAKSIRWVSVPHATIELLEDWKKYQAADAEKKGAFYQNKDNLLFTQENGSPMHPDSVTTWLKRFSDRHKLPHINPHKFRHTMASMLLYNHVDPVSVSRRLGHSQVSTTTDIYSHVIEEADRQNAEMLSDIFLNRA